MTEPDLNAADESAPVVEDAPAEAVTEPEPEDEPDAAYDPNTQVITEGGEVRDMPSGAWTAALTPSGNLRRKKGLLVLAS